MQMRTVGEVAVGKGPGLGAGRGIDTGAPTATAAAAAVVLQTGLLSTTAGATKDGSLGVGGTRCPGHRHLWGRLENSEAAAAGIEMVLGTALSSRCRRTDGFVPNSRNRDRSTEGGVAAGPLVVSTSESWRE